MLLGTIYKTVFMKHFLIFIALTALTIGASSCVNEELEIDPIESSQLIEEESELFLFLSQITEEETEATSVTCIDFIYAFRVFVYDQFDEFVNASVVTGDLDFWQLLTGVPEGYSVGISFPISATLDDGTEFLIENKDQLAQAILACVTQLQDAELTRATENFSNPVCAWVVEAQEDQEPSVWENSVFKISDTGALVYYDKGIGYSGTWIFYYIANQLHLNIFLDSTVAEIPENWNKDWLVRIESDGHMVLTNDDLEYNLIRKCLPDEVFCTSLLFKECEPLDTPDIATFNFEDYSYCIGIITEQPQDSGFTFAYFETEVDAQDNTNELPASGYINTSNPQDIYVRITNPDDLSWSLTQITIFAESCL